MKIALNLIERSGDLVSSWRVPTRRNSHKHRDEGLYLDELLNTKTGKSSKNVLELFGNSENSCVKNNRSITTLSDGQDSSNVRPILVAANNFSSLSDDHRILLFTIGEVLYILWVSASQFTHRHENLDVLIHHLFLLIAKELLARRVERTDDGIGGDNASRDWEKRNNLNLLL
jgi:hypothetical protein